ncbi:MAG: D-alanyl-D-alanine carboxypeptidase family protein [Ruminococcaceae bacterium]|nr:D-alanyl-D-alanine carboxypeptidase family protein [Oscillospiraceae bacterium]
MKNSSAFKMVAGFMLLFVFVGAILFAAGNGSVTPPPAETAAENLQTQAPETPAATPSEKPAETKVPETAVPETPSKAADLPDIDLNSWEFKLVNAENSIADYAPPELSPAENGQQFDSRAIDALNSFIAAAREQGLSVFLSSTYRDFATQKYLYNRKVAEYGEQTAKTIVAPPGTSEHQLGLAADITDKRYEYKNAQLENTALYKWMSANCQDYGFIVRYPKDKTEVTGIMYEPWHFRYVGIPAAKYIMEKGICLEEFLELYK